LARAVRPAPDDDAESNQMPKAVVLPESDDAGVAAATERTDEE
jgi:hypothetical protein